MDDLISRQAAIDEIKDIYEWHDNVSKERIIEHFKRLPSAQPEIKPIEYRDCADAMLKMWIDNVVSDGEYNRIMDKLNAHWGKNNG